MKSHASFLAAISLLASAGCSVDTQSAVVIDGFHPLVFEQDENSCVPREEPFTSGDYDAGLGQHGRSYYTYINLRNNLPENSDQSAGRLNSNDFQLQAVEVTIDNTGPWKFLPASQTVALSAGVQVNEAELVPVPLISPTLAGAMVQGTPELPSPVANVGDAFPLMVRVRARGVLLDGSEVESNEMQFPLTIYNARVQGACPAGEAAVGCSLMYVDDVAVPVQPDGWTCVKPITSGN